MQFLLLRWVDLEGVLGSIKNIDLSRMSCKSVVKLPQNAVLDAGDVMGLRAAATIYLSTPKPGALGRRFKSSAEYMQYKKGKDRLDKISQEYYGSPIFGWLILQANPLIGSIEFEIPDNVFLRVPYPLVNSLQDYKRSVELYTLYYGKQ